MDPIARRDEGSQEVKHPPAPLGSQKSFDVLKNERQRPFPGYDLCEASDQGVPLVARPPHPSRRKALARGATDDDRYFGRISVHGNGLADDMIAQICPIGPYRSFVIVHSPDDIEPCGAKPQAQAPGTTEQVRN